MITDLIAQRGRVGAALTVLMFWSHITAHTLTASSASAICAGTGSRVWVKDSRKAMFLSEQGEFSGQVAFGAELLKLGQDGKGNCRIILHGWFDNFFGHPKQTDTQALDVNHMGGNVFLEPGKFGGPKITQIEGSGILPYVRQQEQSFEVCLEGFMPCASLTGRPQDLKPGFSDSVTGTGMPPTCDSPGKPVIITEKEDALMAIVGTSLQIQLAYGALLREIGQPKNNRTPVALQGWIQASESRLLDSHTLKAFSDTILADPSATAVEIGTVKEGREIPFHAVVDGQYFQVCLTGNLPSRVLRPATPQDFQQGYTGKCYPDAAPLWMISREQNRLKSESGRLLAKVEFGTRLQVLDPEPRDGRYRVALAGWTRSYQAEQVNDHTIETGLSTHLESGPQSHANVATLADNTRFPLIGRQSLANGIVGYQLCIQGFAQASSVTDDAAKVVRLAEQHTATLRRENLARYAQVSGRLSGNGIQTTSFTGILYNERDSYENVVALGIFTGSLSILPHISKIRNEELKSRSLPVTTRDNTPYMIPFKEIRRIHLSGTMGRIILKSGKELKGEIRAQAGNRVSHLSFVQPGKKVMTLALPCECKLSFDH